ncbi:MAG: ATP-binding cassette domain-containing protein, partial [Methylococcaceae bacterium]|nr:ATP-binding cassette domain-containing protein [Methylococcaceae bacterium]
RTQQERECVQQKETMVADILTGRETVKIFDLGDYWQQKQTDLQIKVMSASMARGQSTDYFRIISQSTSLMFTVTLTSVGALAILEQEMTIGALIAANMLGSRLIAPFIQLVEHWRTFAQFHKALNRLNAFFKISLDKTEHLLDFPITQGTIHLQELFFNYDDQQNPAIAGLDGVIGPNGLHLLTGRNGSGKSTLLKLISGLYLPAKGKVSLDQADLRQFSRAQLHQYIGYLPQKIELFYGSIYENITMGMEICEQNDVIEIAKQVQLHELVTQLPMGYETILQEGGRGVSGGVLQKIALTRTLIRKPKILLLDEPGNNLDSDAEQALVTFLSQYAEDHTVIVATHSPVMIQSATSMVVLEQGKVAIAGAASMVMEKLATQKKNNER